VRGFYQFLAENHREELVEIVRELDTLLRTNQWEFGADTNTRLQRILMRLRRLL
jgi:hypothetical protein